MLFNCFCCTMKLKAPYTVTAHVPELVVVLTDDSFGKNCNPNLVKLPPLSILHNFNLYFLFSKYSTSTILCLMTQMISTLWLAWIYSQLSWSTLPSKAWGNVIRLWRNHRIHLNLMLFFCFLPRGTVEKHVSRVLFMTIGEKNPIKHINTLPLCLVK